MTLPNIIFIVLDTLRADRFLSMHEKVNLNLFIEKILDNSINFENCIANTPWTLPSHISMFTGLYPTQSKVLTKEADKVSSKTPLIAEILKELGYYTMCYTENAFISQNFGLTKGFDEVEQVWDWNPWARAKYPLSPLEHILNKINGIFEKKIKKSLLFKPWSYLKDLVERVIKYIVKSFFFEDILFKLKNETLKDLEKYKEKIRAKPKDKPIFLFVNVITPHDPYIPLKKVFKSFDISIDDFKAIKNMLIESLQYRFKINIDSERLSNKRLEVIKKLYDACALSSDIMVQKIFQILKELNILENSYVVITSDHGEHLGDREDHYLWEHSTYISLYEGVLKVPLLIYHNDFKKRTVQKQVQLIDLFHTILQMTGIPPEKNKYLDESKSILNQINGNSTPKYVFGEFLKSRETIDIVKAHQKTANRILLPKALNNLYFLRTNEFKYIKYNNGDAELYNLKNDPNEQENIISKNIEKSKDMKSRMEKLLVRISDLSELEKLLTIQEKDMIKKSISEFKIKGI